jgi:hypothetical protein
MLLSLPVKAAEYLDKSEVVLIIRASIFVNIVGRWLVALINNMLSKLPA